VDITARQFADKMNNYQYNLKQYFKESEKMAKEIEKQLEKLGYE
jgi:ABC-type Zn uptake system ZnuABC Zn-binding protein ZnuA